MAALGVAPRSAHPAQAPVEPPPPWIRMAVRDVLERSPGFRDMPPGQRRALAQAMVRVSTLAAELIAEEGQAEGEIERRAPARPAPPLATAQSAQPQFGEAARRIAGTTREVLNAVSFPRFVTDLINGVFKAMLDANSQQMHQYVQLLNAVSASAEGFERTQFGLHQVRQWVADHFPESIEYDAPDPEDMPGPDKPMDADELADLQEELANIKLRLRGGGMPAEEEIRATLGIPPEEAVSASNPEQLVPLARRYLARQRQQQLATMVMLGMQRIVIDSGRINASMRFHIDTRSAASQDTGSEFGFMNRVKGSGSFGAGPWGVSAEAENTISYVSTERNQRTEEINTDLELNSSVELNFHTDYLPLNQMAAQAQADRIRNNTINPAADIPDPSAARAARLQAQHDSERDRRSGLNSAADSLRRSLPSPPPPAPPAPSARTPAPGAGADAAGGGAGIGGGTTGARGAGSGGAGSAGGAAAGGGSGSGGGASGGAAGAGSSGGSGGAAGTGAGGAAGSGAGAGAGGSGGAAGAGTASGAGGASGGARAGAGAGSGGAAGAGSATGGAAGAGGAAGSGGTGSGGAAGGTAGAGGSAGTGGAGGTAGAGAGAGGGGGGTGAGAGIGAAIGDALRNLF
ncbi:hypothetical protein Psesu_0869 [Pseudoxanthomonas suwonensis 11-1]|uniref:Uncharacterized protein n=1 Tax=Pseudoxanthomonas suwonensis (strain 11-1) TaxID=743721 RepID=E6WRJ0_PSEUU|nr:hypothetical protein [Pseudoxanthomonas suwonensis]ADV26721.1 hypothetical protein Psesu_0869 [Pseudoxanthomonas suwonensis 11-1]